MKRRDFIQISSLGLTALLAERCNSPEQYDIEFKNDMAIGHLVLESRAFPVTKNLRTNYLIAGGGIAGMSAAWQLRNEDFLLFELSDMLGGTSASSMFGDVPVCHGAHYDLSYPSNYGTETLQMLEDLKIIKYDTFSDSWEFVDKQYLIPKIRESRTFAYGAFRKDVLPEGTERTVFTKLVSEFAGKMVMPTRLIDVQYRYLNEISFLNWLQEQMQVSEEFIEGLDYNMKDDYGAGAQTVSALAGIHYFTCRPYFTQPVELFSPPEGNAYFINKIQAQLPPQNIFKSHVVKLIHERDDGFDVEIIDGQKGEITMVKCVRIVYAGNKHALKFIYPHDFHAFQKNEYAPWVVVNFVLRDHSNEPAFWQNEFISGDKSFIGFVDSKAQFSKQQDKRVLTAYFCFKPEEREMMSQIEARKLHFIGNTISYLETYLGRSLKKQIEKVFVKQMGHAMPIPKPGYLFRNANDALHNPNLVYAGVDNGRLPLLFEALDSGLIAAMELQRL
jgi:protoporphyrinogen oxidase